MAPEPAERPKLPDTIVLTHRPGTYSLLIDGVEFPWLVADPVVVQVGSDDMPGVSVRIQAKDIRVIHAVTPERPAVPAPAAAEPVHHQVDSLDVFSPCAVDGEPWPCAHARSEPVAP